MTFKQFKITTLSLLLTSAVFAQKFDKKFSEKFNTNKDVLVNINATNADIEVTTWNKNEVSVEAVIEVEGLDKKEAEKFLKNWQFEALGNRSKVQIKTGSNNYRSLGKNNFVYFNTNGNNPARIYRHNNDDNIIVIPEMPEMPEVIEIPEMPEIVIPEINFDEIVYGLEDIEFDFDKYAKDGGNYFFQWKDGVNDITIKSKKEWETFKKTKKYKKFKESQEKRKKALKKRLKEVEAKRVNKKEMRRAMEKARAEVRKVNREEIRRELANARKEIERARKEVNKTRYSYSYSTNSNDFTINDKKVKVTKKIIIKVPKDATFDLNTRHCKVKLPKTKASGKVSYGTFKADVLNGGKLNVSFSPVIINSLNACTLFLNNVTDAQVASVANTTLNSNSSRLTVDAIFKDVEISNKFGELTINKIAPNCNSLKILLNYSDAGINSLGINNKLNFDSSGNMKTSKNGDIKFNGNFTVVSKDEKIEIAGKYSQLTLKKQ